MRPWSVAQGLKVSVWETQHARLAGLSYQGPRLNHTLKSGTQRIALPLGRNRTHLLSGSRIRARGAMGTATLMLDPASGGSGSSVETVALASGFTFDPLPA